MDPRSDYPLGTRRPDLVETPGGHRLDQITLEAARTGAITGLEIRATPETLHVRRWGTDPWTQGYVTNWRPGDVAAVGPLHGTQAPPLYVCGSDQWVAGYMEGAVRTGRAAARAALAHG